MPVDLFDRLTTMLCFQDSPGAVSYRAVERVASGRVIFNDQYLHRSNTGLTGGRARLVYTENEWLKSIFLRTTSICHRTVLHCSEAALGSEWKRICERSKSWVVGPTDW